MDLNVTYYTMKDGDPWGLYINGHVDKQTALAAFNEEAKKLGFESMSIGQVEHTFGATDQSDKSEFNFYITTKDLEGAIPITYVDGDTLEIMTERTKQEITDFNAVKAELEEKGTLAATIEWGQQGEWLGMIYELNSDYETEEDQKHFAKLVFNGAERV